jgi:hypothetical protein
MHNIFNLTDTKVAIYIYIYIILVLLKRMEGVKHHLNICIQVHCKIDKENNSEL